MKSRQALILLLISTFTIFSGCAFRPTRENPQMQTPNSDAFLKIVKADFQEAPEQDWWKHYQSADLNQLMSELKLNNLDLASARHRINQAKALLGIQRSDNWPALNAQLSQRSSRNGDSAPPNATNTSSTSNLSFTAGYEVDVWGSRSAAQYSAEIKIIAQQQEYQSLLLQLQATLAQTYFNYLSLQARYRIAEQNLTASKELLDLVRLRFDAGIASGIEVNQQRNTWLAAQTSVLDIEHSRSAVGRALSVILVNESLHAPPLIVTFENIENPEVRLIQPATLLKFRPDIRLAESQLHIENASLYQAKLNRWPQLNLSANLSLNDVLKSGGEWTSSFVSSLTAPLFNAGKINREITLSENDVSIAELHYRQTVMLAMEEALNTLSDLEYQKNLLRVREQELLNNQSLYDLAKLRYESGDTDFISLLSAQRSWFNARDNLIQAKNDRLLASVNVFKAMGVAPLVEEEEKQQ